MGRKGWRFYDWGVPLGALIAAMTGGLESAARLAMAWSVMQVASIGVADAVRRGCAGLISRRKVAGTVLMGVLMTGLCTVAAVVGAEFVTPAPYAQAWIAAAGALTAAGCVSELFAARGDGLSLIMSELLMGIAVTVAVMAGDGMTAFVSALCVLAVMLAVALLTGNRELPQPDFGFLKELPAGLLRSGLYPALGVGLMIWNEHFSHKTTDFWEITALFAGFLVISLSKSTFRRSESESGSVCVGLSLAGVFCGILHAQSNFTLVEIAGMMTVVLSAGCGLLLFAPANARTIVTACLLILAAFVPPVWKLTELLQCGMTLAAALMMIPEWGSLARGWRANRLRKRLQKRV